MAQDPYSATAFVSSNSEFSIVGVYDFLEAKYARATNVSVVRDEKNVQVDFGSWFLNIAFAEQPPSPTDDQQILDSPREMPAGLYLADSRRVHILSDDPYPNMDHCNDFFIVCERVSDSFDGVFVRDNASGRWI